MSTSKESFAFSSNTSKSKYDFAMLNVTTLSSPLLLLTFVELDMGRVQVSVTAPSVLLKSTHLGVLGRDPCTVESVVPEHTLSGEDVAIVSAARQAFERVWARVARGGGFDGGVCVRLAFARPAITTVFGFLVGTAAHRASAR